MKRGYIDPGSKMFGWAIFDISDTLINCGYTSVVSLYKTIVHPLDKVSYLMIEKPQIYRDRFNKGDPNDNISVAIAIGELKYRFNTTTIQLVHPRQWKGTVPKTIMLKRIKKQLSTKELKLIHNLKLAESYEHNVVDATGLGLWNLGRFD